MDWRIWGPEKVVSAVTSCCCSRLICVRTPAACKSMMGQVLDCDGNKKTELRSHDCWPIKWLLYFCCWSIDRQIHGFLAEWTRGSYLYASLTSTFHRAIAADGRLLLNIDPKDQIPGQKVQGTHTHWSVISVHRSNTCVFSAVGWWMTVTICLQWLRRDVHSKSLTIYSVHPSARSQDFLSIVTVYR